MLLKLNCYQNFYLVLATNATSVLQPNIGNASTGSTHHSHSKQQQSSTSTILQKGPQPRGRKPKLNREDRVKSPSGSQAILEDVGYSNAHIFTRFYQGQNVHGLNINRKLFKKYGSNS